MISTNSMYQQQVRSITVANQNWLSAGMRLSTMQRVVNPSDDALAASQAVRLKQSLGLNEQYQTSRNFAGSNISLSLNVLGNVNNTIFAIQDSLVQAGNGTYTDQDRTTMAEQLEGLKDELLALANTRDGLGNYIFSGFKTDTVPFAKDPITGQVTYQGGDTPISQKVDSTREMNVSFLGSDVFNGMPSNPVLEPDSTPSGIDGIFATLDNAIAALKTPVDQGGQAAQDAFTAEMDKANRAMRNALANVTRVETEMGLSLQEIDNMNDLGAQTHLNVESRISDMIDLDPVKGISDYMLKLNSLQASYQTFTDMKGLSLFNYR